MNSTAYKLNESYSELGKKLCEPLIDGQWVSEPLGMWAAGVLQGDSPSTAGEGTGVCKLSMVCWPEELNLQLGAPCACNSIQAIPECPSNWDLIIV